MSAIDVDYLVLGSGIAGLTFALKASAHGSVALVTKKSDTESNTNYAQGGIASVMSADDTFESHMCDTLVAGAGLCREDAVRLLVTEGPGHIRELMELGAKFSMEQGPDGRPQLALGREGGHSNRRIVHAADLTGREVERALVSQVKRQGNIRLFEHDFAIDLIVGDGTCCGAWVLDTETEDVTVLRAKVTMLATGGCGRVYLHTTNPEIATGDGVAMAYRAGAEIANMEFIQFHPTSLYHPEARSFLISEAVRGEGAILRLRDGSTFMEAYHPMGCLAPRDVVARAIDTELKKSGDECVFLDITHLDAETIRRRFPNIYEKCLSVDIDITADWIPIVPAAHYSCGGVVTGADARTSLPRLYACGEVTCTGVHGANRLASNSLLEALVFADRAARDSARLMDSKPCEDLPEYPKREHSRYVSPAETEELVGQIQRVMWKHVGIVRTDERLNLALAEIREISAHVEKLFASGKLRPDVLELRNLATVSELIVRSAISRRESRGLHYNLDCPKTDDAHWKKDTVVLGI
ncbi:MAG: L-aspartate oxidase [Armatimonadota bacterium]